MKNIVITGSTRGIGLAMAKEFLRAGCNVTISGRREAIPPHLQIELDKQVGNIDKRLESVPKKQMEMAMALKASSIPSERYMYVSCDVRNMGDLENLWEISTKKWGRIDIWINNAGRNSPYEYCSDIDKSDVDEIIDTNIKGVVFGSQVAIRNMPDQGGGQIWNMEGLGSNDMIQCKTILYGMTKHALTYYTKALAKELKGSNVTAGRLSPGMMLTDFITKTADGLDAPVVKNKSFQSVFNILADRPQTVASFFVPRMLANTGNDSHLVWLTGAKAAWRFLKSPFSKRKLI